MRWHRKPGGWAHWHLARDGYIRRSTRWALRRAWHPSGRAWLHSCGYWQHGWPAAREIARRAGRHPLWWSTRRERTSCIGDALTKYLSLLTYALVHDLLRRAGHIAVRGAICE